MTRIAIISDIHANLHALDLVLEDIQNRGVDKVVCLGDIITKYYYPKETVDMIQKYCDIVIKGNCDDAVVQNPNYKWARGLLGTERLDYLDNLPTSGYIDLGEAIINLYHSNPQDMERMFNPLFTDNDKGNYKDKTIHDYNNMFVGNNPQTTIVGHTHMGYIGTEQDNKLKLEENPTQGKIILPTDKAIINAGSIGEPNSIRLENDKIIPSILPNLTYVLLDDNNLEKGFKAQIIEVPYKAALKQVFFDSVNNQVVGLFPYSPKDTRKIGNSIIEQNPDDLELKELVEAEIERNEESHKGR